MKRVGCLALAAAIILLTPTVRTQGRSAADTLRTPRRAPQAGPADTSRGLPPGPLVATRIDSAAGTGLPSKSPGTAMLLSALLPGAGQAYNESYWKIPVVSGLGIYFVVEFLSSNKQYKYYRDQYNASLLTSESGDSRSKDLREFYKDERDTFGWYFVILYFVNILDAYVDASLFDFSVGGDLSFRSLPSWNSAAPGGVLLSFRYHF